MKWKELKKGLTRQITKEEMLALFCDFPQIWFGRIAFLLLVLLCIIPVLLIPIDLIVGKIDMITGIDKLLFGLVGNLCIAVSLLALGSKFIRIRITGKDSFSCLKRSPYLIYLFILVAWSLAASCMAIDKYTAFFGSEYRADGFFTFCRSIGIFGCAYLLKDSNKPRNLIRIFVITAVLTSMVSVFQNLGSTVWSDVFTTPYASVFFNINHFAYYLTMSVLAANGLFLIEKKITWRLFAIAAAAFELWTLIKADTFGSYIAVLIGSVFAVILFSRNSGKIKIVFFVPLLLFLILTLANINYFISDFSFLFNDVSLISQNHVNANSAGSGRWILWKLSLGYIVKKPIFGYGPEGLYLQYLSSGLNFDRPHNELLQYAAFTGIPGLLLYLGFLISLFRSRWKKIKSCSPETLAAALCVVGYFASSMFGNTMFYTVPFYFMFLGLVAAGRPDSRLELS